MAQVCREIAGNYRVSGVHLDYVRYPAPGYGIGGPAEKFIQAGGVGAEYVRPREKQVQEHRQVGKKEDAWRIRQIDRLVVQASTAVKSVAPAAAVSAAVYPEFKTAKERYSQDWLSWLQRGWVSFVVPMMYSTDIHVFKRRLAALQEQVPYSKVLVGIGAYRQEHTGADIVERIGLVRVSGYPGFALFSADALKQRSDLTGYLRRYLGKPAFLPHTKAGYFVWPPRLGGEP